MSTAIIKAERVKAHLPTGRRGETVKAVDGVSFEVQPGESFGVIGESGSGKTTLGRMLVCLARPSEGSIRHDGAVLLEQPRALMQVNRRPYQIIFQDPNAALNPRMTIAQSIREPLDITAKLAMTERDKRVTLLLDRVGLLKRDGAKFPHQLSGGQKQRANIARALAAKPRLIVCDEVVSALDASIQASILNLFADLQEQFNLTYIFITHDLGVVSHISDRIAVMYLGRFVEQGPTNLIMKRPGHPYTMALLSAEPSIDPAHARGKGRIRLQGEIPSPLAPPSGCRFRTRCPLATEECVLVDPPSIEVESDHFVSCHYAGTEHVHALAEQKHR